MTRPSPLRLRDVRVAHGTSVLVDVAGLDLEPGVPVTIVGESGSGKSLLAHALMGTLPPELTVSGTVGGSPLADQAARRRDWATRVAMLPQEPMTALDPTMRVEGAVSEGVRGADRSAARTAARGLLGRLGVGHAARAYPHELSGGMAQRVAFAATTIGGAPVLVADEPSKGLDTVARDELAALLLAHVRADGMLLTITHDLDLARALGGQVLVMRAAGVVESGPVDAVLSTPSHEWTRALLAAEPTAWAPRPVPQTGEALVTATSIARSFAGRPPLFADLALVVHAGERISLSGPSGSGKTTLGNVLLRVLPPSAGRVVHAPGLQGRVQKLHQDPVLSFPARVPLRAGLEDLLRRRRRPRRDLDDLLEATGVGPGLLERRPGQVSGGELQRVAVARAMLTEPLLLLADEATSRLDLLTQAQTAGVLLDQLDRHRTALIWVTHDRSLADAVASRVVAVGARAPAPAGV